MASVLVSATHVSVSVLVSEVPVSTTTLMPTRLWTDLSVTCFLKEYSNKTAATDSPGVYKKAPELMDKEEAPKATFKSQREWVW